MKVLVVTKDIKFHNRTFGTVCLGMNSSYLLTNAVEVAGETGTITIELSCVTEKEQVSDGDVEHSSQVFYFVFLKQK